MSQNSQNKSQNESLNNKSSSSATASSSSSLSSRTDNTPLLCRNNCGFFGNSIFGGSCSKCFREQQKKQHHHQQQQQPQHQQQQQPQSKSAMETLSKVETNRKSVSFQNTVIHENVENNFDVNDVHEMEVYDWLQRMKCKEAASPPSPPVAKNFANHSSAEGRKNSKNGGTLKFRRPTPYPHLPNLSLNQNDSSTIKSLANVDQQQQQQQQQHMSSIISSSSSESGFSCDSISNNSITSSSVGTSGSSSESSNRTSLTSSSKNQPLPSSFRQIVAQIKLTNNKRNHQEAIINKEEEKSPVVAKKANVSSSSQINIEQQPPNQSQPQQSQRKKGKPKCDVCLRSVAVIAFNCRCGGQYCVNHQLANSHQCTFDYRTAGAEEIRKANPKVIAKKI